MDAVQALAPPPIVTPPRRPSSSPFLASPFHWTLLPDGYSPFSVGPARFFWPRPSQPIIASGVSGLCAPASERLASAESPNLLPPRRGAGLKSRVRQPPGMPTILFSPLPGLLSFLDQSHLQTLRSLSAVGDFLAPPTPRGWAGGWRLRVWFIWSPPTFLCFPGDPLLSHRLGSSRPPEGYLPFRGRCPIDLAFSAVLSFSFLLSTTHPKPLGASSPAHHMSRLETLGRGNSMPFPHLCPPLPP